MADDRTPEGPSPGARYDPQEEADDSEAVPGSAGAERAVEQLLEEVETGTEAQPLRVEGLRGHGAIVTGGSTGIGRAVALALARSGVNVAFNYLDDEPDARLAAETTAADVEACGVRAFQSPVDCTRSEAVDAFVDEACERLDGLGVLVNNAGVGRRSALGRMTDDEWNVVLQTNLSGAFYFIRAITPIFRRQEWGKVVNISSIHGIRSEAGLANLSASKAGVLALTRSAAIELGPFNVNVNAVAPGYIRTSRLTRDVSSETLDRVRARSALGRLGDPQDVAEVVLFLCSESARHITGTVLPVDGGYLL